MVTRKMSNQTPGDDEHLQDVPDGAGCAEIWEHLSAKRDDDSGDTDE